MVLTDSEATASAISKINDFPANASVNDEVIFFGAAHGVLDENLEYVFCTYDFDPARASTTGLKLESIIAAIRNGNSRRCLILLDTCQAGPVGEKEAQLLVANNGPTLNVTSIRRSPISMKNNQLKISETSRYIEEMFLLPGSLEGVHVIGASSATGFALEFEGSLNGVFTSALIEAIREGKADRNKDRSVSIEESQEYLNHRVANLTSGAQQPSIVAAEKDQDIEFIVE